MTYMTREVALEIARRVSAKMKILEDNFTLDRFGKKVISSLISYSFEEVTADVLTEFTGEEWKYGVSDNDPDVSNGKIPLEIKVTADKRAWRGGGFTNRPGDYLLVRWESFDDFFITFLHMREKDWIQSGHEKYFATSFSKTQLCTKHRQDLLGELVEVRTKQNGDPRIVPNIFMKTENINLTKEN